MMNRSEQKTILLVENEAPATIRWKKNLENFGYSVIRADSGERALKMVDKTPGIDLILMDMEPGGKMDGVQAAGQILEKQDLPIVFILSSPDTEILKKVERISSFGFVTRKSSVAELNSYLRMALRLYESNENARKELAGRKRAEDVLRKTQLTVDESPLSIFWISPEGKFIYVNKTAANKLGYSPDELLSMHVWDVDPNYPKEKREEQWNLHRQAGERIVESDHMRRDGTTFPVKINIYHLDFEGQEMEVAEAEDITDRKRAEEALNNERRLLRTIIDSVPDSIYVKDLEGRKIIANKVECQYCGFEKEEDVIGKSDFDLYPSDMAKEFYKDDEKVLKEGKSIKNREEMVYNLEGEPVWLLTSKLPFYNEKGHISGLVGMGRDITDRKRAEEALKESQARLEAILGHSPLLITEVDLDGRYLLANPVIEHFFKKPPTQVIGKTFSELLPPETTRIFMERIERVKTEQAPISIEDNLQTDDGMRYYLTTLFPLKDETGNFRSVGSIAYDITDRKLAEQALEKSLKEKDVLLSEIHHRVKNNMAVISSMLALQSEFQDIHKNPWALLKDITRRIESMALVHEMVYEHQNFAEINAGKLLKRLVGHLQQIYQYSAGNISVEIRTGDIMLDMNNSVPFTLLVNEVVTNAFKHAFTDRRTGRIDVLLERQEQGQGLRLVVQDDGVGLANPDKLNKAESFGYTIIHGLAGQLGGELSFSTPQQGGLRVEVRFPEE